MGFDLALDTDTGDVFSLWYLGSEGHVKVIGARVMFTSVSVTDPGPLERYKALVIERYKPSVPCCWGATSQSGIEAHFSGIDRWIAEHPDARWTLC